MTGEDYFSTAKENYDRWMIYYEKASLLEAEVIRNKKLIVEKEDVVFKKDSEINETQMIVEDTTQQIIDLTELKEANT